MTKTALFTKKEQRIVSEIALDLGITYLKRWTKKELVKFRRQPVVIPAGDYRFFVGPYTVEGLNENCWRVIDDDKFVHDFVSKLNALLYCLSSMKFTVKRGHIPEDLLKYDRIVGNLNSDLVYYNRGLDTAKKKKDKEKYEFLLNRYIDAKMQRDGALSNLKKTIKSAKYLNFRNTNDEIN